MNQPPPEYLPPDLTDEEIAWITMPLKQPAAQLRFFMRLGVYATRRPNNTLLVNRQHYISTRYGMSEHARLLEHKKQRRGG